MLAKEAGEGIFALRLEPGEEIVASLTDFCTHRQITAAAVRGIGSIDSPVLAHYRKDRQKYSEKSIDGILEIASLEGNISQFQEGPLVHLHVVVSDYQMNAYAGHLVRGEVSATAEIFIQVVPGALIKKEDPGIGLKLWQL